MKLGPDPKLFDDLARVASGAVNVLSGLQQQIQADVKSRVEDMATRLDLVPRADLERAEARIAKLEKDVAALMKNTQGKPAKAAAAKQPVAKKKKP